MGKVQVRVAAVLAVLAVFCAACGSGQAQQVTRPSGEDVGKALLKCGLAIPFHKGANDPQASEFERGLCRVARDELIKSAVKDLSPGRKEVERAAVFNLVVLGLDGKLPPNRDEIVQRLRREVGSKDAAAYEFVELLFRLQQLVGPNRTR